MVDAYPLCSVLDSPYTFLHNRKFSSFSTSCRYLKFPNNLSHFIIHSSFQNPSAKQQHPDEKSSPLLKTNILVNPIYPKTKKILNHSFLMKQAKILNSCNPNENDVYEIIKGFGVHVTQRNACFILNNMSKTDNAMFVFRYFMQTFEPFKPVILYNVMLKLFKESKEFENAEKLFDEMLQRMVKPDIITFTTVIMCAILCSKHHKAVEWFEMMGSFECEPNENISSSVTSSYACIGNVDMALRLYSRAKEEKWKVNNMVFLALIKMYGKLGNYDRCLSVYNDMKVFDVKPNISIYHNLLYAMGKAKRAWEAKAIYEEMINNGISPNQLTYKTVLHIYCRGRYKVDALSVYKEMKEKGMDIGKVLYRMLLDMCADVGYIDEAVEIFQDMKSSGTCHPDSVTYTSLITMYSRAGKFSEAEAMLNEMMNCGFEPNILVLTSLAGCYGKAKRTDDVVRIVNQLLDLGINPDDRFCDCLLYVMIQLPKEEHGKITDCIQKANPKLGFVVRYLMEERDGDANFRKEASELFNSIDDFVIKKSMCNSLIDLCVIMDVPDRACDLLNLGRTLEVYTNVQNRSQTKWSLYLKSLSTGTAQQVYEILSGLGSNVTQSDAENILHNISNPETAILALKYFQQKIVPEKHVILYNVVLKLFREIKDFERAEKLFDEMLQRGNKPNIVTFSNLIRCAAVSSLLHKAVELFERMPSFGCKPDYIVSSCMIYVYARIGNVDMALKLYDIAKNEKWPIWIMAFSALIKMYGMLGNYDGCLSVYNDMKVLGVRLNVVLYNALLYAMAKAKRAKYAMGVYEEMRINGFEPNGETYSALLEAYSRRRYSKEALSVYKEMKEKGMTMNKNLYGVLLGMCADVGYIDEAVEIFEDMKRSGTFQPDNFIYSTLIKIYSSNGKVLEAEAMLNEMTSCGLEPNILVLTNLVHCYGKAKRTDDVVKIFNQFMDIGITPDDRLCDSLLYVMTQIPKEELGKITNCIEKANPKLGSILTFLMEEKEDDGYFMKEVSELLSSADEYVKSLCNSLIDICYNLGMEDRAHNLLCLGLTLEIYSNIQWRSETEWCLNLKRLSFGAARIALHIWLDELSKAFESGEELPQVLAIRWRHKPSHNDLAFVFESYLKELNSPFHKATDMSGWFFTTSQEAKSWLQSRGSNEKVADLNSTVLDVPAEALPH